MPTRLPDHMQTNDRRSFLRGLASLPLIGGSIALIGQPSAVAEPVTYKLMDAYKTWLHFERRSLAWEMAMLPEMIAYYGGDRSSRTKILDNCTTMADVGGASNFHSYDGIAPATGRAALVLSTVGCDWRREDV